MRMLLPLLGIWFAGLTVYAQDGKSVFGLNCAPCHGTDANGGELGPGIALRVPARTNEELTTLIRNGLPMAGMPAFANLNDGEVKALLDFLRTIKPREGSAPKRTTITADGKTFAGLVLNQSQFDLQMLGDDRKLHLFRKTGAQMRVVTSQTDWTNYNGGYSGSRYSTLAQINKDNVASLAPKWVFNVKNTGNLQGTPVVSEGVMYITAANECYALDAGSGREIWHYQRLKTKGLVGNASGGINRGVGIAGDRLFMVTDHAHIIALNKVTGALLWETEMADWHQNYNAPARRCRWVISW